MSPVSRGRKPKKRKAGKATRPARAVPAEAFGRPREALVPERRRPSWFDPAIKNVLDGTESTMAALGPRELEETVTRLLGAELHQVLNGGHEGLWFDWWFRELVAAAPAGEPSLRLLHGLAMIATPALERVALAARNRVRKSLDLPRWLAAPPQITATGEVLRMRDAYGTRFAVIAGFQHSGESEPSAYLFDIDASGFVRLAHAGMFEDVDAAASDWWARLGATTAPPRPATGDDLLCLVHCDIGEEHLFGDEPRAVLDNWFRAQRRLHDLAVVLRDRGRPLPAYESLYHGLDIEPMAKEFTDWHTERHGTAPGTEAVEALAGEWLEGTLPETWYSVSPTRLKHIQALVGDWIDDEVTDEVKALLPEWTTWLGERAGPVKR